MLLAYQRRSFPDSAAADCCVISWQIVNRTAIRNWIRKHRTIKKGKTNYEIVVLLKKTPDPLEEKQNVIFYWRRSRRRRRRRGWHGQGHFIPTQAGAFQCEAKDTQEPIFTKLSKNEQNSHINSPPNSADYFFPPTRRQSSIDLPLGSWITMLTGLFWWAILADPDKRPPPAGKWGKPSLHRCRPEPERKSAGN